MTLRKYWDFIQRNLVPKGDITEQAVKSGIWVTLINVFDRILQLAKLVVLARLLAPSDFGLMGIALLTLAGLRQFSKLGIDTALIQREEANVDEYLNTAWSMKAIRGAVITSVAFVLAPYAAQFFGEPRATDIIRVIALSPLITGLQNPGVMYLRKNLEFHKQFVYTLSSTVTNVTVAIGAAIVLQNVWALVYGSLAGSVMTFLVSYVIHGYRPWPQLHRRIAAELFDYGKWILGSGVILFLINQADDAFVGWFLGASALGFYQMAYRFSNAPATEVTHVISSVAFPAYSQVQVEVDDLRKGYFKILQLVVVISIPLSVGIILVAPTFVRVFFDESWLPLIPLMQLLAIWGMTRSFAATTGSLFEAVGKPDVITKFSFISLVVIIFSIYPLTEMFGASGTASAVILGGLATQPLQVYIAVNQVNGDIKQLFGIFGYPMIASFVMTVGVVLLQEIHYPSTIIKFISLTTIGAAIYLSSITILSKYTNWSIASLVKDITGSL